MLHLSYRCPDTAEPVGISISVETIDEADDLVQLEECPRCGEEHWLTLDDIYPDDPSNGEGALVRAPR